MAEQACNILARGRRILLMTGDPYKDSHYLVAKGFHEYMRQEKKEYAVEDLYGYYELDHLDKNVLDILEGKSPGSDLLRVLQRQRCPVQGIKEKRDGRQDSRHCKRCI